MGQETTAADSTRPLSGRLPYVPVGVVVAAIIVALRFLTLPLTKDERHYWNAAVHFSNNLFPGLDALRGYRELTAPFAFIVFGWLEALTGHGLVLGRWLNLTLTIATLLLIARSRSHSRAWRCVWGALVCPYLLSTGTHLYTEPIGIFFSVLGLHLFLRRQLAFAGLAWVLSVSTRQFNVVVPAAVLIWQVGARFRERPRAPMLQLLTTVFPAALGCTALLVWIWIWGAPGPELYVTMRHLVFGPVRVQVEIGLYALAAVGAYQVLPELVLFRREPDVSTYSLIASAILAFLFFMFPPLQNPIWVPTMGVLDRAIQAVVSSDAVRVALFWILASLAASRWTLKLEDWNFGSVLLWIHFAMMCVSHLAWDKYSLLVLVVLWYSISHADKGSLIPTQARKNAERGTLNPQSSTFSIQRSAFLLRSLHCLRNSHTSYTND